MADYKRARVKVTNTQLNKLKSASKTNAGTTLKITKKIFQDEKLSHELFQTKRQKAKIRNALAKNMSTDMKLRMKKRY